MEFFSPLPVIGFLGQCHWMEKLTSREKAALKNSSLRGSESLGYVGVCIHTAQVSSIVSLGLVDNPKECTDSQTQIKEENHSVSDFLSPVSFTINE